MGKHNVRRSNGYRRSELRARVASLGLPCALCGEPIDYSLPPLDPRSFELDEIVPVSLGGDPLDPSNVQPAHRFCNARRGNRTMDQWNSLRASSRAQELPPQVTTDW